MRIGIDARLWAQTGVGRYIRNLVLNLLLIDHDNSYILFARKEDEKEIKDQISKLKIIHSKNSGSSKNLKLKIVLVNLKWHSLSEQYKFPKIIKKENVNLMHFPYIDVPFFYKDPFVITIHDLIYHHFMSGKASTLPIWLYGFKMLSYKIVINNAARKAKKVIAVSNATREEIFDHLMVNKRNVEVIPEAADDFDHFSIKEPNINNYFLYVGNVYPHKNVDNLLKAFMELKDKKIKLVFIGSDDYFYKRLKKNTSNLIKEKRVLILENVTDDELTGLYKRAIALIRPSFMEGFSLPPIEAMSVGCPVLVSDIPVHKEVLGESVNYFNPNDYVDMTNKMLYVLNLGDKERQKQIEIGKKLVKKYSWEKVAERTLSIYELASV